MNLYEVKFVNENGGLAVSQVTNANSAEEALKFIVSLHNNFFGVDYDPEMDPTTTVVVTQLEEK